MDANVELDKSGQRATPNGAEPPARPESSARPPESPARPEPSARPESPESPVRPARPEPPEGPTPAEPKPERPAALTGEVLPAGGPHLGKPARPGVPAQPAGPGGPGRPPPPPPPPRPGFLDRYWPAPTGPAHRVAIAAVVAVGLTAAFGMRVAPPGLGWLLVGLVAAAGVTATARAAGTRVPPSRLIWAAAALALLGVGTVRAAGWLFVLCVPIAAACGSIALAGGRTARGVLIGALATPVAAARGLGWFGHGAAGLREAGWSTRLLRLVAALGVGSALLLIFGALFASADPAFAELLDDVTPSIDAPAIVTGVQRFLIFGWGALGAVYLISRPPKLDRLTARGGRPVRRLEWLIPVVLLDAMFVAFVAVQLGAFFGGEKYVLRTAGLTYADYARRGFGQLVVVTILTLAVIAVAAYKAPRADRGDRVALRVVLGALAALALVVVASALARMGAYESAYGLTRLRLLVAACEIWLGLVFVFILVAGIWLRDTSKPLPGGWLARAVFGTGVAMLLTLAVLNPDRFIADRNIDRYERDRRIDVLYLSGLSADAAPAFERLPEPKRSCALRRIAEDLRNKPDPWYQFNWGRWVAQDHKPTRLPDRTCWESL